MKTFFRYASLFVMGLSFSLLVNSETAGDMIVVIVFLCSLMIYIKTHNGK